MLAALARRGWAGRIVWAFAPVQDRHAAPRDRPGAARPRLTRGRGDRRGPRRRLADRSARILRRDALPHRRAAAGARDRLDRPPHRPDAARRRRGGELLDPDARRRGGRRRSNCSRRARCSPTPGAGCVATPATPSSPARGCSRMLARAPAAHLARQRRAPPSDPATSCMQRAAGGSHEERRADACRASARALPRRRCAATAPSGGRPTSSGCARARGARPAAHARARLRARRGPCAASRSRARRWRAEQSA